jgi:integrase
MPRKAAGARLYRRPDTGIWIIRDTGRPDRSTGLRGRQDAEKALAAYIVARDIVAGVRGPDTFPVAEALALYAREHAVTVAAPERIGYAIEALARFWGALTVSDVKGETCRRYARSRVRRFKDGTETPVSSGTVRRELAVLQAALNHCAREGYLTVAPRVTLPEGAPARDRWLTREEAARLLRAAWRLPRGQHLARFILVALYTGTRKDAILRLGFLPSTAGGWVDIDNGVLHRRGEGERETKKRRPPMRLPRKLLAHLRRWEAAGDRWVVSYGGARIGDVQTAFEAARDAAGLPDITPHTLKHTAITWAMQRGMRLDDAAQYFGTSRETILRTYWHHSPDFQVEAAAIMDRRDETVRPHRLRPSEGGRTVNEKVTMQ